MIAWHLEELVAICSKQAGALIGDVPNQTALKSAQELHKIQCLMFALDVHVYEKVEEMNALSIFGKSQSQLQ